MTKLNVLPNPTTINNTMQLNKAVTKLTAVLQTTIKENIRITKPRPDSKDGGTENSTA